MRIRVGLFMLVIFALFGVMTLSGLIDKAEAIKTQGDEYSCQISSGMYARDPKKKKECYFFRNACYVPEGWIIVPSCDKHDK